MMIITLYGIPNCDTVKKARAWLAEHAVDYTFADFKKSPPSIALIEQWLNDIPLQVLLNKRGTTWRKLSEEQKQAAESQQGALQLLVEQPSMIKRPILAVEHKSYAGFDTDIYTTVLLKSN